MWGIVRFAMRYRIRVRYHGDEIRTHGWCDGVSVPRIDFVWREVSETQLERLRSNPLFEIDSVIPITPSKKSTKPNE